MKLIASIAAIALLAATLHADNTPIRTTSRYGIGCMGYVPPGQSPPKELPPQSYLVSDIGKPGFPKLEPRDARVVRKIRRDHPSKTLRIAWVARGANVSGLIVFDAFDGPCEDWAAGYKVLNGACNEYYEPGENPYVTHGVMGCY